MMINRILEHVHHNVLMIFSLLIVNALYPSYFFNMTIPDKSCMGPY